MRRVRRYRGSRVVHRSGLIVVVRECGGSGHVSVRLVEAFAEAELVKKRKPLVELPLELFLSGEKKRKRESFNENLSRYRYKSASNINFNPTQVLF